MFLKYLISLFINNKLTHKPRFLYLEYMATVVLPQLPINNHGNVAIPITSALIGKNLLNARRGSRNTLVIATVDALRRRFKFSGANANWQSFSDWQVLPIQGASTTYYAFIKG